MNKRIGLLSAVLFFVAMPTWAEDVERFDGHIVYFNAFNADLLDQRVTQAYQLRSGCSDGVLTIAVRKEDGTAVAADIEATAVTLVGQRNTLAMKEVRDGKSIYYVGSFVIGAAAEPLKFSIQLRPEGTSRAHHFEFSRQLFRC